MQMVVLQPFAQTTTLFIPVEITPSASASKDFVQVRRNVAG